MRCDRFLAGVLFTLLAVGCGQPQSNDGSRADGGSAANDLAQGDGPGSAVHRFLDAVRAGNDEKASAMLSPVARAKTAEYDMVVAPPGSDTASFQVGEVEMIGEEGAHVASMWTDVDEQGQKHTDTIIWMVRKLPEGWRIAGMATRVFEDKPAVILNFEEPEDMMAKQQEIEEEMSRRLGGVTETADQNEKISSEEPRRR